ncbi:MAG: hypothetical protein ABSA83_11635 [Verrucomicrobiota bacterium]
MAPKTQIPGYQGKSLAQTFAFADFEHFAMAQPSQHVGWEHDAFLHGQNTLNFFLARISTNYPESARNSGVGWPREKAQKASATVEAAAADRQEQKSSFATISFFFILNPFRSRLPGQFITRTILLNYSFVNRF